MITGPDGPDIAPADVERLVDKLACYHAFHATGVDLLRRLGRGEEARTAYDKAVELAGNTAGSPTPPGVATSCDPDDFVFVVAAS